MNNQNELAAIIDQADRLEAISVMRLLTDDEYGELVMLLRRQDQFSDEEWAAL